MRKIDSEVGWIPIPFSAIHSKETIQSQHYKIEKKSSALKMDFDGIQEGKIINQIKTSLFKNLYYRYKIYFIKPK